MFLSYVLVVVVVCLVFVVFSRVIVVLGVGCRILLSYFCSLSFDVKLSSSIVFTASLFQFVSVLLCNSLSIILIPSEEFPKLGYVGLA